MYYVAQHKGWSKQHKDKSRASPSRLTRLSFSTDMTLTMWHNKNVTSSHFYVLFVILSQSSPTTVYNHFCFLSLRYS